MTSPAVPYIDLTSAQIARVKGILAQYLPADLPGQTRIPILVFGSRGNGKGKAHRGSDIDLALVTQQALPSSVMTNLREAFNASDLPHRVDLVDWAVTEASFRARIEEDGYSVLAPDFFVSYTNANLDWAQWVAWQLEEAGYTTVMQDWDFKPGQNFVAQMHDAARYSRHTLAVLSPAYLQSPWCQSEWLAAVVQDPVGRHQKFIGVRVANYTPSGLLTGRIHIDLVGKAAGAAKADLLAGVHKALQAGRNKPKAEPPLPQGMKDDGTGGNSDAKPTGLTPLWRSASPPLHFPGRAIPWLGAPPPDVSHFVGREHRLQQAQQALLNPRHTEPVLIGGPPGVGKTSFAKQLANSMAQQFDVLAWVGADGEGQLSQNYAALSHDLGLGLAPDAKQAEHIQAVRHHIETQARVLLVFDNADFKVDEWDALRAYLPKGQTGSRAIVTSRSTAVDGMQPLDLEVFTPEESTLFWREYVPAHAEQASSTLAQLSQDLGHLPLALRQAAAYMQQTGLAPADYAALWQKAHNQLPLLDERSGLQDYPRSLATTLRLSFDRLQHDSPAAHQLLCLCTQFAPDAVPLDLLAQGLTALDEEGQTTFNQTLPELAQVLEQGANSLEWIDQRLVLNASGLARCEGQDLSWHRLSHLFLRDSQTAEKKQALWHLAGEMLDTQWQEGINVNIGHWPSFERWLAHTENWAQSVSEEEIESTWWLRLAKLRNQMAVYLQVTGRFDQALPNFAHAFEIRESILGSQDLITAVSINNLATCLQAQGELELAKPLFVRVLAIRKNVLGNEAIETASAMHNLAALYYELGEYPNALPLLEQALEIRETKLGHDDLDTAASLDHLALLHQKQGNPLKALPLQERALAIRLLRLGENHPVTANSFNNLATLFFDSSEYHKALFLMERAHTIYQTVFGEQHAKTQACLESIQLIKRHLKD